MDEKQMNNIPFKFKEEVKAARNCIIMYYCFTDLDELESKMLLSYLIDVKTTIQYRCSDKGYEDYLLYTTADMQEKLGANFSEHQITKTLKDLVNHNYIFVHNKIDANGKEMCNGDKYIKLNHEKILDILSASIHNS